MTRAARTVPAAVWWITALHLVLLLAYSILLPTFRAPDEPLHADLAVLFADETRYPAWDEGQTSGGMQEAMRLMRFSDRSANLVPAEAPPRDRSLSIQQVGGGTPPSGINQLTQHPPLYYVATGGALRAVETVTGGEVGSFVVQTWVLRLMSVAMVAPLPLIVWHIARRLRLPAGVGVTASLVPLAIPQLQHIGSSVNNDNLLMLTFWLLTPVVIRIANGQISPRTAALAGVITGVGMLAKGFALLMPLWVGAALALALYRGRRTALRPVTLAGVVYGVTSLLVGGWWWIRNVLVFGELAPSRFDQLVPDREGVSLDLLAFLQRWGDRTIRRFWGDFGWGDTYLPRGVFIGATVAVVLVLSVAVVRRDRLAATSVGTRALLLAPLGLLVANQLYRALASHLRTGQHGGLQGRYWFGAVAAMSVLVALGLAQLVRRLDRWLPLAVFAVATAMHTLAVGLLLRFYWGAPQSPFTDRVRAMLAWAPVPRGVVIAGAVMGALVAVITLVHLVVTAVRAGPKAVSASPTASTG